MLVAGLVLVPVAVLAVEIQLARGGTEIPAPDVATLTTTVGTGEPVRILWLGDSTAAAVGTSSATHAVSSQVARRLDGVASHNEVIAHSGDRVGDVLRDQLPRVKALRPDLVIISIGANDTVHLTQAGTFNRRYGELVDRLVAAGVPASHIVLVGVPDMGSPPRLAQPLRAIVGWRSRRLDREVKAVAKSHGARYVDLFTPTSKRFRANPAKYFAADKYHPSDAGYAMWGDVIAPAVAAISRG